LLDKFENLVAVTDAAGDARGACFAHKRFMGFVRLSVARGRLVGSSAER
jgi:hypothetical protein